jgi:hypothetical protein
MFRMSCADLVGVLGLRPGVRRAGLPRLSPPLTPGQRRRVRRRLDLIRLNSATHADVLGLASVGNVVSVWPSHTAQAMSFPFSLAIPRVRISFPFSPAIHTARRHIASVGSGVFV